MQNEPLTDRTGWNADWISDATYRTKFTTLPMIIADWTAEYGGLAGKDILDFGCGEATTALAIALRHQQNRVVGIDIGNDFEQCGPLAKSQLGMDQLPSNLELHQIQAGSLHNTLDRFDIIYSWSVFEHVEQRILPKMLNLLRDALNPGGLLFIQIAPLYYSAEGSHLMPWIPEPWGHLTNQHSVYFDKLSAACPDETQLNALWSMFETLNKVTSSELQQYIQDSGFEILRNYQTRAAHVVPLNLARIYNPEILLNEQVVLLSKKT